MSNPAQAVELVERGLATMLEGLKRIDHREDWVDQHHSPIGKRAHLDAIRGGLVRGYKVGRLLLVRRADLDAYIEQHRVHRVTVDEEREDEAEIEAIINEPAKPRRAKR